MCQNKLSWYLITNSHFSQEIRCEEGPGRDFYFAPQLLLLLPAAATTTYYYHYYYYYYCYYNYYYYHNYCFCCFLFCCRYHCLQRGPWCRPSTGAPTTCTCDRQRATWSEWMDESRSNLLDPSQTHVHTLTCTHSLSIPISLANIYTPKREKSTVR